MAVELLKQKTYDDQLNVWVERSLKQRFVRLKQEHRVNTAAEIRKVLITLVDRLEKEVNAA